MGLPAGHALKPLWGRKMAAVMFRASPFGAGARLVSRPIDAFRAVQQWFQALKPAGGRFRGLERPWQVVHGLRSRLMWFRVRAWLGLEGDCWWSGPIPDGWLLAGGREELEMRWMLVEGAGYEPLKGKGMMLAAHQFDPEIPFYFLRRVCHLLRLMYISAIAPIPPTAKRINTIIGNHDCDSFGETAFTGLLTFIVVEIISEYSIPS